MEGEKRERGGVVLAYLAAIGIGAYGGWWFGNKLTTEALAVVVGVVAGVIAVIPTLVIFLAAMKPFRRNQQPTSSHQQIDPQVIVLSTPDGPASQTISRSDYDLPRPARQWIFADRSEDDE